MNRPHDDALGEPLDRLPTHPVPALLAARVRELAHTRLPGKPSRASIVASRAFALALVALSFVCLRWAVMFTSDLYR